MDTLHKNHHDLALATCSLVPNTGPILVKDQMDDWSAAEGEGEGVKVWGWVRDGEGDCEINPLEKYISAREGIYIKKMTEEVCIIIFWE